MKVQSVVFARKAGVEWESGIAILSSSFNCNDVQRIVDEKGVMVTAIFDYNLVLGPLSCIDTHYKES